MTPRRESRSRRIDTRVTVWAPPDGEDTANLSAYGELDRSADNWIRKGTYTVSIDAKGANDSPAFDQSATSGTYQVEIERRDDWSLEWRLEILDGPNKGRYLYPSSVAFADARARTMILTCTIARTV